MPSTVSTPRKPFPRGMPGSCGMAREPHLVLLGDRDHALQEVGDALPVDVGVDRTGGRQRRILLASA